MLRAVMAYDRDRDSTPKDDKDTTSDNTGTPHDVASREVAPGPASTQQNLTAAGRPDEPGQVADQPATKSNRSDSRSEKSPQRRAAPARSRRVIEDDYDDDEEDDEEGDGEDDEEEREISRRPRRRRRSVRPRVPRRKLDLPTTEEALNVPKLQTIGMLGSVSLLMIIMWFTAKLACNAHPDQIRDPRYYSVDQLARDPKNAAFEFQLRYVAKDYLVAGELVSGKMAEKIRELLKFCEGNMDSCEKDRLALKDKITGTAALLEQSPSRATVEITTLINNENPQTVTLDLVPSGLVWKVTESRDGSMRRTDSVPSAAVGSPVPPQGP
jgi:hypothetical protein